MLIAKIIIVTLLSGWIFARIKQNGHSINKISIDEFGLDMLFGGASIWACYGLCITIAGITNVTLVLLISTVSLVVVVWGGVMVVWIIIARLPKVIAIITPRLMRKNNG